MYDLGDKRLNGIKSIYVNSLACVRGKEISRTRAMQMDNLSMLSIRRMDRVPNVWIRKLC